MAKVAIIYYSQTGTTHKLAHTVEEDARNAGAEMRLLRVRKASRTKTYGNIPNWKEYLEATSDIRETPNGDLEWADAIGFGTPTGYGLPSAQLKNFID